MPCAQAPGVAGGYHIAKETVEYNLPSPGELVCQLALSGTRINEKRYGDCPGVALSPGIMFNRDQGLVGVPTYRGHFHGRACAEDRLQR